MKPVARPAPRFIGIILCIAAILYISLWVLHVATATASLQAFSDDSALVFLLHLTGTPLMGGDSVWLHFFSAGWSRDGQFLLNALALQTALGIGIRDPQMLKYIFVGWEYALPGFLYLALFYVLYKKDKIAWAVFPLAGWALLGVSIDWNPVNSTRWAMPLFWMHFLLVLLAGKKIRRAPCLAVIGLGILMAAGLYESVVAECGLALGAGAVLYLRERNRTPLLYALASVPGALRACFSLMGDNSTAPNSYHGIIMPYLLGEPYFILIAVALVCVAGLSFVPRRGQIYAFSAAGLALVFLASNMLLADLPQPQLETGMKYDYAVLSLVLMGWCGLWRVLRLPPGSFAPYGAILALLVGSALWLVKIDETQEWQDCRTAYDHLRAPETLWADTQLSGVLSVRTHLASLDPQSFDRCLWGQYTPWTDMLLAPGGKIAHWSLLSFWQNFSFVDHQGAVFFHSNGLSLVSPALHPLEMDMPVKTPLYDMSALYEQTGLGSLFPRAHCLPVEESDDYWQQHLSLLDNDQRRRMNVCPRRDE